MKIRRIYVVTYESLSEFLDLSDGEFITDIISDSKERCSEKIVIKVANGEKWGVHEGAEIPRQNYTRKENP